MGKITRMSEMSDEKLQRFSDRKKGKVCLVFNSRLSSPSGTRKVSSAKKQASAASENPSIRTVKEMLSELSAEGLKRRIRELRGE